eukprot:scaffold255829_cov17-Tisochrysis_lutea.AAC.1
MSHLSRTWTHRGMWLGSKSCRRLTCRTAPRAAHRAQHSAWCGRRWGTMKAGASSRGERAGSRAAVWRCGSRVHCPCRGRRTRSGWLCLRQVCGGRGKTVVRASRFS